MPRPPQRNSSRRPTDRRRNGRGDDAPRREPMMPFDAATAEQVRAAVAMLIESLVREPAAAAVSVNEREDGSTLVEVRVSESDMGRLIGREGRTAKALRSFLFAASNKYRHRFALDLVE